MIARLAILEGMVKPEYRAAFDADMSGQVKQAIERYPNIRRVFLRRPLEQDVGAPQIYLIFELHFDNLASMNAALASPIRLNVRSLIAKAMERFEGRVYHLVLGEMTGL